jgi:integrase
VFTDELGKPIDPGRVSKEFARVRRTADLERIRLHDLRHTHTSLFLAANVHPKIVSERLDHASVTITLDIYSHVLPGLQEDAAEKFSQIIADGRLGLAVFLKPMLPECCQEPVFTSRHTAGVRI